MENFEPANKKRKLDGKNNQEEIKDKSTNWKKNPKKIKVKKKQSQVTIPPRTKKLTGWEFFKSIGSPKYVCAPMVGRSCAAFRKLVNNHFCELSYSPMLFGENFAIGTTKLKEMYLTTLNGDYPMFLQIAANDIDHLKGAIRQSLEMEDQLLSEGKISKRNIVAFDLNLGCPQKLAQKRNFGAFLMDDLPLVEKIVKSIAEDDSLPIPITVKIRVFPEYKKTLEYVKMLVKSGASLVCIHGRTRKQKGVGLPDYEQIRKIKEEIKEVPIYANGNVKSLGDAKKVLELTKCDGVMVANGLLANPALFDHNYIDTPLNKLAIAKEYCSIIKTDKPTDTNTKKEWGTSIVRSHMYKMLNKLLQQNVHLRTVMILSEFEEIEFIIEELIHRFTHNKWLNKTEEDHLAIIKTKDPKTGKYKYNKEDHSATFDKVLDLIDRFDKSKTNKRMKKKQAYREQRRKKIEAETLNKLQD